MEIIVFQQFGSGEKKIQGIMQYGENITIQKVIDYSEVFPEVIDYPETIILREFSCDLVLNYLKHPDLSSYLIEICCKKGIPVVSAGTTGQGFTPFTCCGLVKSVSLGEYGRQFGFPEYEINEQNGKIEAIRVIRGAPCGATWSALDCIRGLSIEEALLRLPLRVQQFCVADPSAFDPLTGKSPVHFAADVHLAALRRALRGCLLSQS